MTVDNPGGAPAGDPNPNPNPNPAPNPAPGGDPAPKPGDPPKPADPAPKPPEPKPGDSPAPKPGDPPKPEDFKVPEKYKDKGWASKVKSMDDVYEQLDTLDSMKGRPAARPDLAKATPEQREAFYAQGRPKDINEYQFTEGADLDDTVKAAVPQMLSKYGIDAYTGNQIIKDYQEMEKALVAKQFDQEGFNGAMKEHFGDNWEAQTALAQNAIKKVGSEADIKALDKIPNLYAAPIYRIVGNMRQVITNMMKQYGVKETDMAHFMPSGAQPAGGDLKSQQSQLRQQIATNEQKGNFAANGELRKKLADSYKNDPRRTDVAR